MIKDKKFFRMDSILRPLERVILTTAETYKQPAGWRVGEGSREARGRETDVCAVVPCSIKLLELNHCPWMWF